MEFIQKEIQLPAFPRGFNLITLNVTEIEEENKRQYEELLYANKHLNAQSEELKQITLVQEEINNKLTQSELAWQFAEHPDPLPGGQTSNI